RTVRRQPRRLAPPCSDHLDAVGYRPLLAHPRREAHALIRLERTHAGPLQGPHRDIDVLPAVIGRDEAKPLLRVEELHRPFDGRRGPARGSSVHPPRRRGSCSHRFDPVDDGDLRSLPALRNVAQQDGALGEVVVAGLLHGRNVEKRVGRAVARLHEAEALGSVVPFDDSRYVLLADTHRIVVAAMHHLSVSSTSSGPHGPVAGARGPAAHQYRRATPTSRALRVQPSIRNERPVPGASFPTRLDGLAIGDLPTTVAASRYLTGR